jgi:hypothetical protein
MAETLPMSTLPDVMAALGAKTSDLVALDQDQRRGVREDLDREILAFHKEGKEHPCPAVAKKFPLT